MKYDRTNLTLFEVALDYWRKKYEFKNWWDIYS